MADPQSYSASDVEIAPSYSASDVEMQEPALPPAVQHAIAGVPRPGAPSELIPRAGYDYPMQSPSAPAAPQPSFARRAAGVVTDALTNPAPGAESAIPSLGPEVVQGAGELQTRGQRARGGLRLAATGLDALTPAVGPAALEAPITTALGFGEGYVAGKGAKYGAKKLGASPETQDLAESVGQLAPVVGHAILRPEIGFQSSPEGDAAAVSAGVRGAGAGVAVTPEATVVRGRVGSVQKEVRIPRAKKPPAAPELTPQTIEGELATNPPTRDEIADAQAATNYAGPEQAKAAVVAKRQADRAATTSAAPPSGPEGAKAAGVVEKTPTPAVSPETSESVTGEVLPPSTPLPKSPLEVIKNELRDQYPGNSEGQIESAAKEQLEFENAQARGGQPPETKPLELSAHQVEIESAPAAAAAPQFSASQVEKMAVDRKAVEMAQAERDSGKLPAGVSYVQRAQQIKDQLLNEPEHPSLDVGDHREHTEMVPTPEVARLQNENVQMVPTSELDRYKEFDRRQTPGVGSDAQYIDRLKEDIQQNGLREPLILRYGTEDRKAHLWEGNHRLAAAKELGIKELPVRVETAKKTEDHYGVDVRGHQMQGEVPAHLKPSDIGITARALAEKASEPAAEFKSSDVEIAKYKHRSTQVNIPEDSEAHAALDAARQRISKADLAGDGKDIGGNHVTVRWGLTAGDNDKLEKLKQYLSSLSPFDATLGPTSKFKPSESSDGAAVIQAPIEAPELHAINAELEKHADFTEPTFDKYTPHATVAYVKADKADRYVGMKATEGKKFRVNSIAITDRMGNQEEVKLEGNGNATAKQNLSVRMVPGGWGVIGEGGKILDRAKTRAKADALLADRQHGPLVIKTIRGGTEQFSPKTLTTAPTIEGDNEPENQPARAAGEAEDLPSVSEPARESGNPPVAVSPEGNRAPAQDQSVEPSTRSADRERVEQPARQPGERNEPARSGGSGAAAHPAAERTARRAGPPRATGADGKPVDAPTPETPEQATTTIAEARNQRNFRISDEFAEKVGSGGEITKIKGNLDALETLKKIQAEGRELATPEERETLAKYVDFGGLVGMLQRWWEPQYKGHYERFQKLLTEDERQEIRETLPNTHYTSMQMVDWMWKAMSRMGVKGGRILEPGMGIGNFMGRVPEKIANRAELFGVERNPLTGGMAKLLYPDAHIAVKPFQEFLVPNNSLDAVIGNVPFQDVNITDDPAYLKPKLNLHNYFIVKSLDKLKPGGIAALITSRYTMDSGKGQRAREEMAKRADLVAAIRLPDAAFKRNAGTEVVADLLIFQKRAADDVVDKMPEWTTLAPLKVGDKEFLISKYFVDNPNHVLGEHSQEGKMYGPGQYTVKGPQDFGAALEGAHDLIPSKIFGRLKTPDVASAPSTLDAGELQFAPEDVKPGAFYKDEKGNIRVKEAGVGVELPPELRGIDKQVHIAKAIDLRDQLNHTIQTQLETSDDAPLKEEQQKLEKLYDAYRKEYGPLHGPKLHKVFGEDPEYPKLLALENLDTESKAVSKAAIFTKRVLAPYEPLRELPDEPKSAMLKVMAERGYLDTALMASLLNKPEAAVIADLEAKDLLFQDPHTGNYHTADEYLSGNVRDKLREAEKAAATDKKFQRHVEALKKVQPERLSIHDIQPNLGQTWIPVPIYKSFVQHLAQNRGEVEISRDASGKWLVQLGNMNRFHLEHEWSGGGIQGHKLVQAALNQQQPTVWIKNEDGSRSVDGQATTAAREKLAVIKEEFRTVLRKANQGVVDQLENIYNDTFNAFRLREFSGEHLDFPGMSEEWRSKIRGYQKAGVWRILQEGRAGLFHAPGLGKTLTMAAAGMEARRLKLSRKNMYAVPNHMVNQWREDFKRFYPNANVLAVSDEDFNAQNRAKLMSRIATGDWDAVIVPHSQFDLLPMSPEWESKTINKRLADYREVLGDLDEKDDKRTIKQIEKAIDKLESRLNELNAKKKDNTISFDQMGLDMLFVDEAHAYKAMAVPSRMGNIGGLSNRASQRAFALEMKSDFLRDTHKGRGLVFGTGTPITNTVGELYVMTKYLAPDMLEASGIRSFDDWAANFATTITQWEYAPDGVNFRPKTTLSEFVNVPELSMMFRRYAEYLSKDAAKQLSNLKEPTAKRQDHMLKVTPTQEPLLQMIADRGEQLTKHPPRTTEERKEDNWLKLSSDARKISLDPRLYNPALHDDPGSKANTAVEDIKQTLDATRDKKGTVVVFSDFFQHKGPDDKPDFNLFEDMRKKLVQAGVPKEQMAIIHEAASKNDKEELFAKVRAGKVRVIFGSTDKMGIGTNIQDRLKAELHLDQPWRPDQVEQREGRIVRSGNMWDDIEIHRYIAEPEEGMVKRWDPEQNKEVEKPRPRAYDLQMYQQLARKAHFQEQFLTGNYKGRTMEDVGGDVKLNSQMFELAKAMATGNPDALRKIKVEHDLRTYGMLERNFQVQRSKQLREQSGIEFRLPIVEQKIALLERDSALWAKAEDNVDLQVGDVKRQGEALKDWLSTEPNIADLVGKQIFIGGLRTELDQSFGKDLNKKTGIWEESIDYRYSLAGEEHKVPFDHEKHVHHVRAFLNSFASRARGLGSMLEDARETLQRYKETSAALREEIKKKSPYIDKVESMEKEIREIDKRLGVSVPEKDEGAAPDEEPESLGERLKGESGSFDPSALKPSHIKKVYNQFIDHVIDNTLDLGDKYRRVGEHDPVIAKMLHEKDHAPRYFRDKAQSNVDQVIQGLSDPQIRLAAMMSDSDAREYLEDNHPEQFEEAQDDPAVMAAVNQFKQYQQELSALRINLGWHVRRDLSMVETESGEWEVIDRDGVPVETFKSPKDAQEYVEDNGDILDHLKRTYPEHLREPLMGHTDTGPRVSSGSYGGIRPPKPDKKQRLATGQYFYEHGAKDFSGYLESYAQASHAALNKKIYDQLTTTAEPWKAGTAQPSSIEYNGKTYYRPDVAVSMRSGVGVNKVKHPLEYRAYDPAKDDKLLIKSFEDGWGTMTTGKPGISIHDRWLAPKEVVEALDHYDTTRGAMEKDSIRRFFQEQIVGLFGPTVHMLNIMRRLAHTVGTGAWDPRVWPYYQKLFFSQELRERMAEGLHDDTIDALSKYGTYTNARDVGSLHAYFLGNLNPMNWVRQTVGKFSKGLLFDPKFMGGFGGMDQKARVLAYDFLREHEGMGEEEAAKNVEDGFGNYNRANWTERMKRWAKFLLFPGWDFSSLKWFLRHPLKTAIAPALATLAANLAVNMAGKNKDQDKYDYGYLHYGDRKFRTSLFTESMSMHIAEPILSAGRAALEGGNPQDIGTAAGEGTLRGMGGMAGSLRPDVQMLTSLLTNRQYLGGNKEIYKPEDASIPGKVLPNRKLDKLAVFTLVKSFPAVNRFLDSSYENVDLATGAGSVLGVTNYKSGAEERLKTNVAKAKGYSETLSALAEREPDAAEKFVGDPNKAAYLMFNGDLSTMGKDLADIDKQKDEIALAPGLSGDERRAALDSLKAARQQLLTSADALNDALTAAKLGKASTASAGR